MRMQRLWRRAAATLAAVGSATVLVSACASQQPDRIGQAPYPLAGDGAATPAPTSAGEPSSAGSGCQSCPVLFSQNLSNGNRFEVRARPTSSGADLFRDPEYILQDNEGGILQAIGDPNSFLARDDVVADGRGNFLIRVSGGASAAWVNVVRPSGRTLRVVSGSIDAPTLYGTQNTRVEKQGSTFVVVDAPQPGTAGSGRGAEKRYTWNGREYAESGE